MQRRRLLTAAFELRRASWQRTLVLCGSIALASVPAPLFAQVEERGSDRSAELFREGRKLVNEGRFAEACEKFRASLELRRSPGTLLNVGNCFEAEGRLMAARESFREASKLATAEADARKSALWTAAAREEIDAIEKRLARLTVTSADPALHVTLDGQPLAAALGEPFSADPGRHRIEASGPGKQPFAGEVQLAEGESETLMVPELALLAQSSAAVAAPDALADQATAAESSKLWPWALIGGGGALFAGGAVTGIVAAQMASDLDDECPTEECAARNRAMRTALAADVLMVAGVVVAGAGAAWLLFAEDDTRASITAACGFEGCRAGVNGSF